MSTFHEVFISIAGIWALLLVLGFLAAALRGRSLLDRLLAIDGLGLCVVAVLTLLSIRHAEASYLDGGLALALLAFIGTLAAARLREPGDPL